MSHPKHPRHRVARKPLPANSQHRRSHKALLPLNELASLTAIATLGRKFLNVSLF